MWSSTASQAFENDPTLKDILAATYTSSRRINYAVFNGVDKTVIPMAEELLQQSFNLLLIGNDKTTLEQVKEELIDGITPENDDEQAPNLTVDFIWVTSDDWAKPDTHKSIEDTINDLDYTWLLINNYRFYSKTSAIPPPTGMMSGMGVGSPSFILYQSMMKMVPITTVTDIVNRMFYSMQKARGIDLSDKTDASNYQALDSLVLNKTNSTKKKAMKKMALLNIREPIVEANISKKTESEKRFLNEHPQFFEDNDDDNEDNEDNEDRKEQTKTSPEEYKIVVEEYTVNEEKLWDCYQMFWKLINYKYNPYDDTTLADYLAMQEFEKEEEQAFAASQHKEIGGGAKWPFAS
jgi:hypothetical protein